MDRPRVLVVDDEEGIRDLLDDALTGWGYQVSTAGGGGEALGLVTRQVFAVALVDLFLPEMDGLELLRELKRHDQAVDVVMMTGHATVGTAIEALKAGAYDYLEKPLSLDELQTLMGRLVEHRFLHREVTSLRTRLGEQLAVRDLVGVSPQLEELRALVAKVAATESPVLIEGESGTGKELVAARIHRLSPRAHGPFIPVNCGAIPADLLESEFFGHVRGAFTGATAEAVGLFRSAHGGTIFLDEITELPPALQVKLLRVLQEKEVRPVGATATHAVDVRVVAATNRQVESAVQDGSFRQDLFYRLNVVRLVIPSLRERPADIPPLVTHFLRQYNQRFGREVKGIAPEALAALMAYDFPGNVRELENLVERAYALGARAEITLADLPTLSVRSRALAPTGELPTLAAAERELILQALQLHHDDKDQAARALGISRRTLYRRLKEYGLL